MSEQYTITVSREELQYMANLLSGQPYREVADLLLKLQQQVIVQDSQKPPQTNGVPEAAQAK